MAAAAKYSNVFQFLFRRRVSARQRERKSEMDELIRFTNIMSLLVCKRAAH